MRSLHKRSSYNWFDGYLEGLNFKAKLIIYISGLQHLTNLKRGDYYGVASTWPMDKKRTLGVVLLKKSCDIFMAEGERQIKPIDI